MANKHMANVTVDMIRRMDCDFLNAETVAAAMRMRVERFREYARTGQLPFPVQPSGRTIKISRQGFLNWVAGKKQEPETTRTEKLLADIRQEMKVHNLLLEALVRNMAPVSYASMANKIREVYGHESIQAG